MNLTRHAIRVYAALDGLRDKGDDDVIDSLLPFLAPILEIMRGTAFAPQLIVAGVKKLYGWNISTAVAEVFRDRLAVKGYLRPEIVNRVTVLICDPPPEPALSAAEIATTTALDAIVDEFEGFPEKLSSLFHVEKGRAELKEMLVRFLVVLDAFGQDEMLGELRNLTNGSNDEHRLAALEEGGAPLSAEDKYLCARFVSSLYLKKSPLVQYLSQIASVGLLAEVIKDFAQPTGKAKHSNLTIALDAPLALDLLGTSGAAMTAEAKEIVESLKSIGCNFIIFSRSCKEINRVLSTLLSTAKPNRYGATHSAMMKGEVNEEYVKLVRDAPEEALKHHGVAVRSITLDQFPSQHQFFTEETRQDYESGLDWHNDEARNHDAECVTLVMRLRSGKHQRDPLSCGYIFATSNSRLTKYSRDFCLRRSHLNPQHCGPVINYRDLAAIAWLRTGFSGGGDIPRAHLLAACDKVLRVKKELVDKARAAVASVNPDRLEQFDLLLQDKRSVTRLLDSTFGNEARVTDAGIEKLLNEMQRALVADVESEYETKLKQQSAKQRTARERERKQFAEALAEKQKEAMEAKDKLQSMSERLETLEKQKAESLRRSLAERHDTIVALAGVAERINARSRAVDKWMTRVLWVGAVAAAGETVGSLLEFIPPYPIVRWVGVPFGVIAAYHFIQDARHKPVWGLADALGRWAELSWQKELSRQGIDVESLSEALAVTEGHLVFDKEKALAKLGGIRQ